jgi:hypothetical protein
MLAMCFMMVSCFLYSSILKMEAICSSETSDDFILITRCYIPEGTDIHTDRCEDLQNRKVLTPVNLGVAAFSLICVHRLFGETC